MDIARPGPLAELGQAGVIDGDDRDFARRCDLHRIHHPVAIAHRPRESRLHRLRGRIPHREKPAVFVLLAHHRRETREEHQVLRRTHRRRAVSELVGAGMCDRNDAKARERIVERDFDRGAALRRSRTIAA